LEKEKTEIGQADDRAATRPETLDARLYRRAFEEAPDGCLVVDASGRILEVNAQACRLFGYEREAFVEMDVDVLLPESFRMAHARHRRTYLDDPRTRQMGIGLELRGMRSDGSVFPVEIALSPLETSDGLCIIAAVRDTTERRRIREFGRGMLQGAEKERRRIARDLHDDTAQTLAALLMRLQMARRTDDEPERDALLAGMHRDIRRASDGVYRILRGLRPPALEESGIAAALRAHVREAIAPTGLEVRLVADPVDPQMSEDTSLALYRIVQEALANTVRHAEAKTAGIRIILDGESVAVEVDDDGVGFEPGDRLSGLGLLGMEERARILGGSMTIDSSPGRGTRIRIELPLGKAPVAEG